MLTQLRDGVFAKVAMHAVRRLALLTFEHMHLLSLRFHLERKTGGLTRVLERGRNGIETIVRMVILQLRADHRRARADRRRAALSVRLALRRWRSWSPSRSTCRSPITRPSGASRIRRRMNDSDTDANTKAIDSLLNYETVKYFGAEERETRALRPLDGALRERERQVLHLARACSMPGRRRSSPSGSRPPW